MRLAKSLWTACLLLPCFVVQAPAEYQFDVPDVDVPRGAGWLGASAIVQSLDGLCLPPTLVMGTVTQNSGFPVTNHVVLAQDELMSLCSPGADNLELSGWILALSIWFDCGNHTYEYSLEYAAGELPYCMGPAQPPAGGADFGIDQNVDCTEATSNTKDLAHAFSLQPAYPNPFNPSTTIPFQLDKTQQIRLSIHDLLGAEVMVLVDGLTGAGEHEVRFEAMDFPSGIYIVRLASESTSENNKILLLK